MRAAVVRSFEHPPRYESFALPPASGEDDVVIDVTATALHPRVRSGASGSHYADERVLPRVPGIDGVGRLADGSRVYFVVHDTPFGTMADQVVADRRRCVPLPDGVDDAVVAAGMNPAMSSWIALRLRVPIAAGQSIFVLGATGNAGRMAVQVSKRLGAGRVIGAGRNKERLANLEADEVVSLAGDPDSVAAAIGRAASDVDVVLDYLWGQPAEAAMVAMLSARARRSHPIHWIQIGSVAGPTMALPSVALRSTNLRVLGSGQGSVPVEDIVAELPRLIEELAKGRLTVSPLRVPLADVEATWKAKVPEGQRVVFVPAGVAPR
jgi:NADPH:quinone reductase-like Zn-dependent oxidoreductase